MSSPSSPPSLDAAVGGYRFVQGIDDFPFLYITLGRTANSSLTNDMWALELGSYTWRKVKLDGPRPEPRMNAAGSLERFVRQDGSVRAMLLITHGHGQSGALSDTWKCSFHRTDPYRARWRRVHAPVNPYAFSNPAPGHLLGSSFTAARDLVISSGCYASALTGGSCPSRQTWRLKYDVGNATNTSPDDDSFEDDDDDDDVLWEKLNGAPAPRYDTAMAQGLHAFRDAYPGEGDVVVVYSGSQRWQDLDVDHVLSSSTFDGAEINILNAGQNAWLREHVVYDGDEELRNASLMRRAGASLSVVRANVDGEELEQDKLESEFFLFFGGRLDNGSYTNALLRLSFDPFVASDEIKEGIKYISRPMVHGILMMISFGVLMPAGAMLARYRKDSRGRPRHAGLHVCVQITALIVAWAGMGIEVYGRRRMSAWFSHAHLGLALIVLASLQPVMAAWGVLAGVWGEARVDIGGVVGVGGRVRKLCQLWHAVMGGVVTFGGGVNILLGLWLLKAPGILWVQWAVFLGTLVIAVVWMEAAGGRRNEEDRGVVGISRSWRGESSKEVLRRSRGVGSLSVGGDRDDEIAMSRSIEAGEIVTDDDEDVFQVVESMGSSGRSWSGWDEEDNAGRVQAQEREEMPPISRETIDPMQERVEDVLGVGRAREDSTGGESITSYMSYRERLDSGMSLPNSSFVYRDPDAY